MKTQTYRRETARDLSLPSLLRAVKGLVEGIAGLASRWGRIGVVWLVGSPGKLKCRIEASVTSGPVGARADGVRGAVEGVRIQDPGKADNCAGLVENGFHN